MLASETSYTTNQIRDLLRLSWNLTGVASAEQRLQLLLGAMCRATHATSAYGMLVDDGMTAAGDITLISMHGLRPHRLEEPGSSHFLAEANNLFAMSNPMARPFLTEFSSRHMGPTALSRTQLVSDTEWYSSDHYCQYRRPTGLDDCILSVVPLPGQVPFLSAVCLNQASATSGDTATTSPHFTVHDCQFVELIHSELRWACILGPSRHNHAHQPLTELPKPTADVAPRLQRVLKRLLAGESEKQIANALALSQHTIHEYVRALYRDMGVSSRGELMAKFVAQSETAPAPASSFLGVKSARP